MRWFIYLFLAALTVMYSRAHAQEQMQMQIQYSMTGDAFQESLSFDFSSQIPLSTIVGVINSSSATKALDPMVTDVKFDGQTGDGKNYLMETSTRKFVFTATIVEQCDESLSQSTGTQVWSRRCNLRPDLKQTGWAFASGVRNITCSGNAGEAVHCVAEFSGVLKDFRKVFFSRTARQLAVAGVVETLNLYGALWEYLNHGIALSNAPDAVQVNATP